MMDTGTKTKDLQHTGCTDPVFVSQQHMAPLVERIVSLPYRLSVALALLKHTKSRGFSWSHFVPPKWGSIAS